jgi:hypothetical protein
MTLTPSEVASLTKTLSRWELAEYICAGLVTVGCIGEYCADFTNWLTGGVHERKERLAKCSTLLLIVALSSELICLVRTNQLAEIVIGSLNEQAEEAGNEAAIAHQEASTAAESASQADERASENEKEAARLRKLAEDERLARIKIEERVAWRRLTRAQQAEIGTRLAAFSGEVALIQYDGGDMEEYAFGLDIASAMHLGKWRVAEPLEMIMMREGPVPFGTNPPIETGISIKSTRDQTSRNASDVLLHELLKRGFDVTRDPKNDPRPQSVVFVIMEHRPEGAQGEAKLRHEAEIDKQPQ